MDIRLEFCSLSDYIKVGAISFSFIDRSLNKIVFVFDWAFSRAIFNGLFSWISFHHWNLATHCPVALSYWCSFKSLRGFHWSYNRFLNWIWVRLKSLWGHLDVFFYLRKNCLQRLLGYVLINLNLLWILSLPKIFVISYSLRRSFHLKQSLSFDKWIKLRLLLQNLLFWGCKLRVFLVISYWRHQSRHLTYSLNASCGVRNILEFVKEMSGNSIDLSLVIKSFIHHLMNFGQNCANNLFHLLSYSILNFTLNLHCNKVLYVLFSFIIQFVEFGI